MLLQRGTVLIAWNKRCKNTSQTTVWIGRETPVSDECKSWLNGGQVSQYHIIWLKMMSASHVAYIVFVSEFPRLLKILCTTVLTHHSAKKWLQRCHTKTHFGTFNTEYCTISSSCSIFTGLKWWQKRLEYNINRIIYTVAFDPEDLKSIIDILAIYCELDAKY